VHMSTRSGQVQKEVAAEEEEEEEEESRDAG
jgi:hypothetical protein